MATRAAFASLIASLLASAGLAADASVAASTDAACGPAGARAAVREAAPRLRMLGEVAVVVSPEKVDRVLCGDTTGDGRSDMAVSIASGGSAGDVGYLLFRRVGEAWRLERKGAGYKLGLFRRGSEIEVVQPVYRQNDPNCCPTGGFDRIRLRWQDGRYVVARAWRTRGLS